jgi:hypothetical protein
VAYAYLLRDERIVADVWLYNVVDTPETVDWSDRSQMPFLNPAPYCDRRTPPSLRSHVTCSWSGDTASIIIEGERVAFLRPGAKPGWSVMATKNGPLARRLDEVA